MAAEAVEALAIRPDGHYVDATAGRGGHSAAILARLGPAGRLLVLDRDPAAIAAVTARFGGEPRVTVRKARFGALGATLSGLGWDKVDGILADLGVSSPQLEEGERGFSFRLDGPLDMRMDPTEGESAQEWLAHAPEAEITRCLRDYGEERHARAIARAIVRRRDVKPFTGTRDLAELIASVVRERERGQHPATRSFQAIRIQVNAELDELDAFLPQAMQALRPGGRLAVITFHSLEDRMVKRFFRSGAPTVDARLPLRADELPRPAWRPLGKGLRPGAAEIDRNPRARSACLRVAERLEG